MALLCLALVACVRSATHFTHHRLSSPSKHRLNLPSLDLLNGDLVLLVDAIALGFVVDKDPQAFRVVIRIVHLVVPVSFHLC